MSDEEQEEEELDLTSPEVVTKYKNAAEIVNKALQLVVKECKPNAKIVDICEKGDTFIGEQAICIRMLRGRLRGALPPHLSFCKQHCLSFSPLASDTSELQEGDTVKIDMGCHIDGFIAVVAHTHVVQEGPVTNRKADVVAAANTAAEVALRLVRPGKKNKDVTDAIQKVAAAYDCKIVEGVLGHQLKQFVIDGNKVILELMMRSLKRMKFMQALEEKRARLGLVECVNHDLLQPYPVLHEKPGDYVAHIKFKVLLMPNGSDRITSHPLQELQPTKTIDDPEIKAWLALGTKTKKKGGGKKKGKKGEPMDASTSDAAT
ncbi:ERBB-3 BINDING PROTEIN 1 [Hibiscus syriacus]|uniref:ERBB-3 BINDING PROTEIN 1 n=1 Tax=Hibiscus syriacus TaxID=106335 RepID=A0A6A2WIH4_HIBSY|nr:ERBB-3 BINDING PROTEIN 1 [Hibiscus syriacus]